MTQFVCQNYLHNYCVKFDTFAVPEHTHHMCENSTHDVSFNTSLFAAYSYSLLLNFFYFNLEIELLFGLKSCQFQHREAVPTVRIQTMMNT